MGDRKKPYKRPPRPKKKGGTGDSDSGEELMTLGDNEGSRPRKTPKLAKGISDQSALFELVTATETSEAADQSADEDEVMGEDDEGSDGEEDDDEDDGESGEDGNTGVKCENFDNCKQYLGQGKEHNKPGPNGRLCGRCGVRYATMRRATKQGGQVGEEWRVSGRGQKRRIAADQNPVGKCENFDNCKRYLAQVYTENKPGPKGRLCNACGERYLRMRRSTKQGGQVGEEWRLSRRQPKKKSDAEQGKPGKQETQGKQGEHQKSCKDCHRKLPEDDSTDQCEPCLRREQAGAPQRPTVSSVSSINTPTPLSFTRLREITFREWRTVHQNDPSVLDQRIPVGRNYWTADKVSLRDELRRRGLSGQRKTTFEMVIIIQTDDAWNGYLPRHRPVATLLDSLGSDELLRRAHAAGYSGPGNAQAYVDFLRSKRDIDDEILEIEPENVDFIRDAVTAVRSRLLRAQAGRNNASYRTSNRGMSSEWKAALGRLQITLSNGLSPAWTSGHRLFCGVNALAMSINAVRRFYYGRTNAAVYSTQITPVMLRALLFRNYEQAGQQGVLGDPTPEYEAYLREDWDRTAQNAHARADSYNEMTSLDNFSLLQLIAMVVLAHRAGIIEEEFSLGYVQGSATVDDDGNVAPATAQIVHEADTATVWLHHNLAASIGYDHWEGFEENGADTDTEIVFEWGLSTPLSLDAPRPRFDPKKMQSEDLIFKYSRELINAQRRYTNHLRSKWNACGPCQDAGTYLTCKYTGGRRFCDPCDEREEWEKCHPAEGSTRDLFSNATLGPASQYTAERRLDWLQYQDVAEQEEEMLRSINQLLNPDIEGPNFFVFGHARHSSHPGAPTVLQTMQNLQATLNSYSNFLNIPANQNTVEGTRPGGIGTPMQTHRTVVCRHGTRPVPTHAGNLNDPMLQAFVAMVDHLFRANNPHPPIEIHIVLQGIAGFSVGIEGFGDRTQGFFREMLLRDQANNTNYADRTSLVFVMERAVVDQNAHASINHGLPSHGMRYQTKQIVKVPLGDMIDRHTILKNDALRMGYSMRAYMEQITFLHRGMVSIFNIANPLPLFPQNQARANEIDRMIMGMSWEHDWRSAWLDGTTMPTDAMVAANNVNRNAPM